MLKPYKYTIVCNKTGRVVSETNIAPTTDKLCTWEPAGYDSSIKELKQTRTAYIDTRHEAKLRLYNYVTFTKKGLPVPKYRPFEGTEIGKSVPILNF